MDRAKFIIKNVNEKLKSKDMICKNCEFNFDGLCAAHDSLYGYGGKILNDKESCLEWGISFEFFCELADS